MITIKILNVDEIVKKERGWFVSKIAPHITDVNTRVEEIIAEKILKSLNSENIKARIVIEPEEKA